VLGTPGQLAGDLVDEGLRQGHEMIGVTQAECDITDAVAVERVIRAHQPRAVINGAAWTRVDAAEDHEAEAEAVNAKGPGYVAAACAAAGIRCCHVSTDYVFDGSKPGPYREDDPVNPLGVYGRSKEAGDRALREALVEHVILRTAWVYSAHGHNFVKTMLRLGEIRSEVSVVGDQRGGPTSALDIADAVRATIGIPAVPGSARSCSRAVTPSIPGSSMSIRIRSGRDDRAMSTAASPVPASSV